VSASAVDDDEVMAEYLTVPKVTAVISARILPPADTLMSMGVVVTSTVISHEVQPNTVHAVMSNAANNFSLYCLIVSFLLLE